MPSHQVGCLKWQYVFIIPENRRTSHDGTYLFRLAFFHGKIPQQRLVPNFPVLVKNEICGGSYAEICLVLGNLYHYGAKTCEIRMMQIWRAVCSNGFGVILFAHPASHDLRLMVKDDFCKCNDFSV